MTEKPKFLVVPTTPVKDGVPMFLRYAPAESADTSKNLQDLLEGARTLGWRTALERQYAHDPKFLEYVSSKRSNFLDLLALSSSDHVLEIGPGLGQFTRVMANAVASVTALEIVEGQARFVSESCRQEGFTNVQVGCGGDDCRLPFEDDAFDVVVLSLVLEWCGNRNQSAPHEVSQLTLLKEINRVLKPGGRAYISTKNRYALRYLLGGRDEHTFNMRFGGALPRMIVSILCRLVYRGRPAGWLHSHRKFCELLEAANFRGNTHLWAVPEMRYPTLFVPLASAEVSRVQKDRTISRAETRLSNMLISHVPAAWVKHLSAGLVCVARKPLSP